MPLGVPTGRTVPDDVREEVSVVEVEVQLGREEETGCDSKVPPVPKKVSEIKTRT